MKLMQIAVASTAFTLSRSAHSEDMPGMKMDGREGMQMEQEIKQAHLHRHSVRTCSLRLPIAANEPNREKLGC
jgi:hypothetical protein